MYGMISSTVYYAECEKQRIWPDMSKVLLEGLERTDESRNVGSVIVSV